MSANTRACPKEYTLSHTHTQRQRERKRLRASVGTVRGTEQINTLCGALLQKYILIISRRTEKKNQYLAVCLLMLWLWSQARQNIGNGKCKLLLVQCELSIDLGGQSVIGSQKCLQWISEVFKGIKLLPRHKIYRPGRGRDTVRIILVLILDII